MTGSSRTKIEAAQASRLSTETLIKALIRRTPFHHTEGNTTTYELPNGVKLVIPVGFANKEKAE